MYGSKSREITFITETFLLVFSFFFYFTRRHKKTLSYIQIKIVIIGFNIFIKTTKNTRFFKK